MATDALQPVHPGEVLKEEFLVPFGLSNEAPAVGMHIQIDVIKKIASRQEAITADVALRFAEVRKRNCSAGGVDTHFNF